MIVTSRFDRRMSPAFSAMVLAALGGVRVAAFAISPSMSACCCSSFTAVLGPIPGAPGTLSDESPTKAK